VAVKAPPYSKITISTVKDICMRKKTIYCMSYLLLVAVAVSVCLLSCSEPKQKIFRVGIVTDFSPFIGIADNFYDVTNFLYSPIPCGLHLQYPAY
jgi:hypothetical protein